MDVNPRSSPATLLGRTRRRPAQIDGPADDGARFGPVPRRVLVATDTTPASAGAERAGLELSSRAGASLILLSVIDPSRLRVPGGLFHMRVDQVRSERESALAGIVAHARRLGIAAQFLIWEGDPGASVIEAAEAEGADVIVVGSHARNLVGRLLLGSVSAFVVEHGRRPVVVIRPGQLLDDVWPIEVAPVAR
jgi:nucleotide-binding universal stress UspA family protein